MSACILGLFAASAQSKSPATIESSPSPVVASSPATITITTDWWDADVYVYTWALDNNVPSGNWEGSISDRFKMTKEKKNGKGVYTYSIENIKSFYNLTDSELQSLTKLNFIAHTNSDQTEDCSVEVTQQAPQRYSGGSGTQSDPWKIGTAADLKTMYDTPADITEGHWFVLTSDVSASQLSAPIGSFSKPFAANLDGAGHCITSLNITGNGSYTGLFAFLTGAVKNLGITGATVNGKAITGILAGKIASLGTVERCYTSGTVNATSICVGGLAGENEGAITNCYSSADVNNPSWFATGGLVGKNNGNVKTSFAAGTVKGHNYVGGVAGANYGRIEGCVAANGNMSHGGNYAARFGGNNNSRNVSIGNYSWNGLSSDKQWSEYADHATVKAGALLVKEAEFKNLTAWDFDNVWEWKSQSDRQGPVLKNILGQQPVFPAEMKDDVISGISEIEDVTVMVGPNPTEGTLFITAGAPIQGVCAYSLNGTTVGRMDVAGAESAEFDLAGCSKGMYMLEVTLTDGMRRVFKIIKK